MVIPFKKDSKESSLAGRLKNEELLTRAKKVASRSIGVLLNLKDDFVGIYNDALFLEIDELLKDIPLDPRSKMNYALVLFSTGKVIKVRSNN